MQVRILMVDDHPSQIEGYKIILEYNTSGYEIQATTAFTAENAYKIIVSGADFDVIFLDRSLPAFAEQNIQSGVDLAVLAKQHIPNAKIVMLTSHAEAFMLYNIVKDIHPAGLLVKSDFSGDELLKAFDLIMSGKLYYSETVKQSIGELLSTEKYLDHLNRRIISLLADGVKTKSMPEMLLLSQSAVEKRKANIRDFLRIKKGSTDEEIVREARKRGFI
ncbi:response regulator [Flavobacterium sp. 3HN19-14]|uniref:response regulator n=1 Tax=Flavobacterium sp. 3HN19-14 TaxID=3448133 RepID=UPI003EDEB4C0